MPKDTYIRCPNCDCAFNIARSPFCIKCRDRCLACGSQLKKRDHCECGYPSDEQINRLIEEHAIPASDIDFELQLDLVRAKLRKRRVLFTIVVGCLLTYLARQLLGRGILALVVGLSTAELLSQLLFRSIARAMVDGRRSGT
jgi:hypothetical protein